MTGYTAGILNQRITIHRPATHRDGAYGRVMVPGETIERWAAVDWSRGTKSLREGALDAYDTIMVRLRFDSAITRDCKIEHDGTMYRIDSFHADKCAGTIQLTATELTDVATDNGGDGSDSSSASGSGSGSFSLS